MMRASRAVLCTALCCLTAAPSFAQSKPPIDVDAMTLEQLLAAEVVSTASKFPQEVREAPASITIVSADEIRRYGHRTLADVLRSVRGLYTTYDRNYSYIGIRGFARPGDYNTRVLLLVDGHRLNDGIYDMQAFRPNAYELYYYAPMREHAFTLDPERTHSTELVWEEQISKRVRMAIAGFAYHAHHIIEQRTLDSGDLYYANGGAVQGRGVEAELEARLAGGFSARVSHAAVDTEDGETGTPFWNSPRHVSKVGVQIPVSSFCLAMEAQYVGERLTIAGEPLGGYFTPNVTVTSAAGRRLELMVSVHNAIDRAYADPGAEEHVQQSIPQDGRTLLVRVRARF